MGIYINPENMEKEDYLEKFGTSLDTKELDNLNNFLFEIENTLPVCLVNNGFFTAAGVAFDKREFQVFNNPEDIRLKKWYLMDIDKIKEAISKEDLEILEKYIKDE
jgi:hypothetical protein